jgi:hypothetical protein
MIRDLEEGIFSFTWAADEATRRAAAARLRSWAAEKFGDLQAKHEVTWTVTWRAYDL